MSAIPPTLAARDDPPLLPKPAESDRAAIGFDAQILWRITMMAMRYRIRMTLAIVATALGGAAQVVIPQVIGTAIDEMHGLFTSGVSNDLARETLFATALLLLAVTVFRGLVTMVQNYQGEAVGHLIAHDLRMAFYRQLQRLSFAYHDHMHTGELMTRGILDIEGTRLWVHTGILRVVLLSVLIIGGGALLVQVDFTLSLYALSFVPIVGVGSALARLKLRALWFHLQQQLGVLTQIMEENLGGTRVVRAFAAHQFEIFRFDVISNRALAIAYRRIVLFVGSTTGMTFAFYLSMGLVLWVGGQRVIEDKLTIGELTSFLAFMAILQQPVRQIAWMVNSIARASTCGGRLFEILDLTPDIQDADGAIALSPNPGVLRFENVDFAYPNHQPTLRDINFELSPGKTIGIVGPPGSGKSTIAQLIPRFYDTTAGRVTIDGEDVRSFTLDSLRGFVSLVQQDSFIFTAALAHNVAYSDPWADQSTIRQATATSQLHNYVSQLPLGYGTLVGERGVSLSGGQRQRLAIARGVLPQAGVLVFDDSTAAVDAGTERDIRHALAAHAKRAGVIIIAHRLSSLMHADEILFIEHGTINERGTHRQLIEQNGAYARLYRLQTQIELSEPPATRRLAIGPMVTGALTIRWLMIR
ncbi:MAG: ABC transporter ATP-binding protein [Pseudomonadota bacterium]